jgi:hypothetical protein
MLRENSRMVSKLVRQREREDRRSTSEVFLGGGGNERRLWAKIAYSTFTKTTSMHE